MQRAGQDNELATDFIKNLRVTTVPQEEIDPKKQLNFAKYMYFAMTKNGAHRDAKKPQNDPVIKFVQFLLTREAQDIFIKYADYQLPTQNATLAEKGNTKINSETDFAMTIDDWYVPQQLFALYDMGIPHLMRSVMKQALDEPGTTSGVTAGFVSAYIDCKV
jgi:ABC-type thiamine transport system substrate-binding protein